VPASTNAANAAASYTPGSYYNTQGALPTTSSNDFTFGTDYVPIGSTTPTAMLNISVANAAGPSKGIITLGENTYQNNNSEIMAILRDDGFWPETNTTGQAHIYNPQQTQFYSPPQASGTTTLGTGPGAAGLGTDEVLRDPWGNPFFVTLDMNYDNHAYDPYLDEMYFAQTKGASHLNTSGHAVVWSLGPYAAKVDVSQPLNSQANKYIVHSP
jgi:hypothetical protein